MSVTKLEILDVRCCGIMSRTVLACPILAAVKIQSCQHRIAKRNITGFEKGDSRLA